ESLEELLINLKALAVRAEAGRQPFRASIAAAGREGPVTARDLVVPEGVEIIDPAQVLCTLDGTAAFGAELAFASGQGYVTAAAHAPGAVPPGFTPMDSLFSPVRQVSYRVEQTRLGQVLDYDR